MRFTWLTQLLVAAALILLLMVLAAMMLSTARMTSPQPCDEYTVLEYEQKMIPERCVK